MRIVMAGASGFLGTRLARRLGDEGHEVVRLVRRAPRAAGEVGWQPSARRLDPAALAGADAVINLTGAGIAAPRWTRRYREVLRASRIDPTTTLATTIAALPPAERPRTLLNASGISCYGDTGDRTVDEHAPLGTGVLPDLCRAWEGATAPAAEAGTRVVSLRTAPVLDRAGGLLKPQLLPYKLGIAGTFGSGRQWVPWIALADWLSAATFLLAREDIAGPVNVTSPEPVTNARFTKALGRALHRPTVMPIPAVALKVILGGFAVEVLHGSGALPGVLTGAGFTFRYPDLDAALRAALGKDQTFSQAS